MYPSEIFLNSAKSILFSFRKPLRWTSKELSESCSQLCCGASRIRSSKNLEPDSTKNRNSQPNRKTLDLLEESAAKFCFFWPTGSTCWLSAPTSWAAWRFCGPLLDVRCQSRSRWPTRWNLWRLLSQDNFSAKKSWIGNRFSGSALFWPEFVSKSTPKNNEKELYNSVKIKNFFIKTPKNLVI